MALNRASRRAQESGQNADQAAFAHAVGADNLARLSTTQIERQPGEQHAVAPSAGKILGNKAALFHNALR